MENIRGQIGTCKGKAIIDDGAPTVAQSEQIGRIIGVIMKHSETYKLLSYKYGVDLEGDHCELEDAQHIVGIRRALVFVIEKLENHTPVARDLFMQDIDRICRSSLMGSKVIYVNFW